MLQSYRRRFPLAALLLAAGTGATPALAHDMVLKPRAVQVEAGAPVALDVLLTEVYFVPDRVLPAEAVTSTLASAGGITKVALAADPQAKALTGSAPAPSAGTFIATAALSRVRQAPGQAKDAPPDPAKATLSEAYAKAVLNAKAGDAGFGATLGHRLEIVPLANPAELTAGAELPIKVLFDGKPIKTRILATYDGFSGRDHTFAYASATEEDGTGFVKVSSPGLWFVKISHEAPEAAATHARYSGAASLVFAVK